MLTVNQAITLNFASKEKVVVSEFKYKQGEIDKSGIEINLQGASIQPGTIIKTNWLYTSEYDYIYVQNNGVYVSGTKLKIYPPQDTLLPGMVSFEVLLVEQVAGEDVSQLKGPTVMVSVVEALIDDEEAAMEDENISAIIALINENERLIGVANSLNADIRAEEAVRDANETARNAMLDGKVATVNSTIQTANSSTSAANASATAANTAATNANNAATAANTAKTNADAATAAANTATTNANTATTTANNAATAANTSATAANTAATNANNAATAANTATSLANTAKTQLEAAITSSASAVSELTAARTDASGTVHANLKTRLDKDFNTLASAIPKNLSFNGSETIVADNTISGNVNNGLVSGETLVNRYPLSGTKGGWISASDTFNGWAHPPLEVELSSLKMGSTYTAICFDKLGELSRSATLRYRLLSTGGNNIQFDFSSPWKPTSFIAKQDYLPSNHVYFIFAQGTFDPIMPTSYAQENITIMLLEGDHTDKPLEFFEGLKSAEISEVETHGVNLVDVHKSSGQWQSTWNPLTHEIKSTSSVGVSYVMLGKFYLEAGKRYRHWFESKNNQIVKYTLWKSGITAKEYNFNNVPVSDSEEGWYDLGVYVRLEQTDYVYPYVYEVNPNTPAKYIPYESTKLTTPEPVILRSLPNGVADTLDLETGVLTRRCGEVVLNGGNYNWAENPPWTSNTHITVFSEVVANKVRSTVVCDKFKESSDIKNLQLESTQEVVDGHSDRERIYIRITKSKLTTPNVDGFKAWLTANPTTVVYQLATPTTEIIDLDGYLKSHDIQTTITAPSVIPAKLSFDIPVSLKHWLESNSVSMTMLANDASTQQALIDDLGLAQESQAEELTAAQMAIIDLYEMGV